VVLDLEDPNAEAFPTWQEPTPGVGGVRMFDRTAAAWVPCFAELDSHEGVTDPAVLVRPAVALPSGHDVAVVVTTDVIPRPVAFEALVLGQESESLSAIADTTRGLLDELAAAGLPTEDVALAFDFPIHGPTDVLDSAAALATPGAFRFTEVRTLDDASTAPPRR